MVTTRIAALTLALALIATGCGDGDDNGRLVATCDDGVRNGDESDVDCGGTCGGCALGASCVEASDCAVGVCGEDARCGCEAGFEPDDDGGCADADECATDAHDCAADATCTNEDGGFSCACEAGFAGDGRTCAPCSAGRWGADCAEACVAEGCMGAVSCDPVDGSGATCAEGCAPGFYGPTCAETCAQGDCTGTVTCEQDTGAATACEACAPGFYGATCASACAQGDCTGTVTCEQDTGAVTACEACAPGFYGATCAETCEQGDCTGTVTCEQDTGAATACEACAPGFYGATCASACAQGDCTGTVTCEQDTGAVTACEACAPGFYGATCADTCAQGDCTGTVTCEQDTGAVTACEACADGYRGATCADTCAQGDCIGTVTCEQDTGAVTACEACADGFHGATCADTCAQGDCTGTVTCEQDTGAVTACEACAPGYYGATCASACAQGDCTGTVTCEQDTGAVTACEACADGYHGPTCADTCEQGRCTETLACDQATGAPTLCADCQPGTWGAGCQNDCDPGGCLDFTCDAATGELLTCDACLPGWFGPACDSDWWDTRWRYRVPLDVAVTEAPAGATHAQVAVDVARACYDIDLPEILYAYHFSVDEETHVDSLDGHGGFAPLAHGGVMADGREGGGVRLDGVNDWIDLQDVATAGPFTLSSWVRLDRLPTDSPAIVSAWKDREVYELRVAGDPSICTLGGGGAGPWLMAQVHPIGLGEPNLCSTTSLSADRWYFAAMTWDGRWVRLYVDGQLEAEFDYGVDAALDPFTPDVRVGTDRSNVPFLPGTVDDVVLLGGALDEAGVQALMAPRCRRDLGDLRVFDRDLGALLPHWVESDGRVVVQVPVADPPHDLDLYFGHPTAPDGSDGPATFELFDDFAAGLDAAAWTAGDACGGGHAIAAEYGKLRTTSACDTLTSTLPFDATPLVASADVWRSGGGGQVCADHALLWPGAPLTAAARLGYDALHGVAVAESAAVCADDVTGPASAAAVGTLSLAQTPDGAFASAALDDAVLGPLASGDLALTSPEKGPLTAVLHGVGGAPRWLDNVRVAIPHVASVATGALETCAGSEGVGCCVHADCDAGAYCADGVCADADGVWPEVWTVDFSGNVLPEGWYVHQAIRGGSVRNNRLEAQATDQSVIIARDLDPAAAPPTRVEIDLRGQIRNSYWGSIVTIYLQGADTGVSVQARCETYDHNYNQIQVRLPGEGEFHHRRVEYANVFPVLNFRIVFEADRVTTRVSREDNGQVLVDITRVGTPLRVEALEVVRAQAYHTTGSGVTWLDDLEVRLYR